MPLTFKQLLLLKVRIVLSAVYVCSSGLLYCFVEPCSCIDFSVLYLVRVPAHLEVEEMPAVI